MGSALNMDGMKLFFMSDAERNVKVCFYIFEPSLPAQAGSYYIQAYNSTARTL